MNWITQNWPTVVSIAGALYTLLSIINGLIQNPVAKSWMGKALDGLSFLSRASAPGTVKAPLTMSKPIEPAPARPTTFAVLPLLLLPLLFALAACPPTPPPVGPNNVGADAGVSNLQIFDAALAQCEKNENISEATGSEGAQILSILMTGGFTAQQLLQKIEDIGVFASTDEVKILASCAVYAYLQIKAVAPGAKPTPSQAAARLYLARHLHTLKHTGTASSPPHAEGIHLDTNMNSATVTIGPIHAINLNDMGWLSMTAEARPGYGAMFITTAEATPKPFLVASSAR